MVPLLQIFQGSNKLRWQAFEWLWNIPHGQQSSITSIPVPWLGIIISCRSRPCFSPVTVSGPTMDIMISPLLFISKKCCVTAYNTSSMTRSPRVSRWNIYLIVSGAFVVWLRPTDVFSWRLSSFEAVCMVQNEALHSVRCHTPTVLTSILYGPWCAHNI